MTDIYPDMICQVLANERSEKVVLGALRTFLGVYQDASPDNAEFAKTIATHGACETFYWHDQEGKNLMLGVNLTTDNMLVMSLTLDATDRTADLYLEKLKSHLNSEVGIISSPFPADYSDGQNFKKLYEEITS